MRIFVTGATGFIGKALTRRLLARADEVVALARNPGKARPLAEAGAQIATGDLLDAASLAAAARSCEAVIHCAGVPRPATLRMFRRIHVDGTRAVIDAARSAGVRRFVNVASQAVIFCGRDLDGASEGSPYPDCYIDPYSATKAEAERIALAANDPGRFETTSLRPPVVWGRGDTTILPIFARLASGPFGIPRLSAANKPEATIHIENLTDALIAAIDSPRAAGRAYFIVDGFVTPWWDFLSRQLDAAGVRPRFLRLPAGPACAAAWAIDSMCGRLGLRVPLAHFGARLSLTARRYQTTRARDELGWTPRVGLDDGLADLAGWVRELGGSRALMALAR